MGKDLHYLILEFFKQRMRAHGKVRDFSEIEDDNNIIYHIERVEGLPDLNVHLSDAYIYTLHDYYSKPQVLGMGDFILSARPEADFDEEIVAVAAKDRIGIGKIGKFMSALHHKDVWSCDGAS